MTGWRVQRNDEGGATWTYGITLPATDTSFTDDNDGTGLADLTTYWYRYRPVGPGIAAAYSVPVDATTGLAVAQDVAVTATGPHGVDVTWEDDSQHETGYTVTVTNTDTSQTLTHDTLAANATTTSFTDLPPGYYVATVITKNGSTTTTQVDSGGNYTTDEAPTIDTVTVLSPTRGQYPVGGGYDDQPASVHLAFTNHSTRVTRDVVEWRRKDPQGEWVDDNFAAVPTGLTGYVDANTRYVIMPDDGWSYVFKVVAMSDGVYAKASAATTPVVAGVAILATLNPPDDLHYDSNHDLQWSAVTGADNYEVQVICNDAASAPALGVGRDGLTWYRESSTGVGVGVDNALLKHGVQYTFRIRSYDHDGYASEWSTVTQDYFHAATAFAPSASNVTATRNGDGSYDFAWTEPTPPSSGNWNYAVVLADATGHISHDAGGNLVSGSSVHVDAEGGENFEEGLTQVRIYTDFGPDGTDAASVPAVASVVAAPLAPAFLGSQPVSTGRLVTFEDTSAFATGGTMQRSSDDGVTWTAVGTFATDSIQFVDTTADVLRDYLYRALFTTTFGALATTGPTSKPSLPGDAIGVHVDVDFYNGTTIVDKPENDKHDGEKAVAGDIDQLGPLDVGTGRSKKERPAIVNATMIVGTVAKPEDPSKLTFRFRRTVMVRAWTITNTGGAWAVSQDKGNPGEGPLIATPVPDNEDPAFEDDTPSKPDKKMYLYDNSGATLVHANGAQKDDVYFMEKQFSVWCQVKDKDGIWVDCSDKMDYTHEIIALCAKDARNEAFDKKWIVKLNEVKKGTTDCLWNAAKGLAALQAAHPEVPNNTTINATSFGDPNSN